MRGRRGKAPRLIQILFFVLVGLSFSVTVIYSQDLNAFSKTLNSGSTEEKRDVLMQLRSLRSEEASRVAVSALKDGNPMVRATAVSSVIFLPKVEAAAALLPLLNDKDEFVRSEAAYALGTVGDPSAASHLIKSLTADKSQAVCSAAAVSLGKVGNPDVVSPLVAVLNQTPTENNEMLRRAAARSIGQIAQIMRSGKVLVITPQNFLPERFKDFKDIDAKPSPDLLAHFAGAVKMLIHVLDSTKEADDTRREAAFALGAIGDPSAMPVLSKYISSSDVYLAEISKEALLKLRAVE